MTTTLLCYEKAGCAYPFGSLRGRSSSSLTTSASPYLAEAVLGEPRDILEGVL